MSDDFDFNIDAKVDNWTRDIKDELDEGHYSDLESLVRLYVDVGNRLDALSTAKAEMHKLNELLRINKIPDLMDEQGITSVTFDGIGRVTLTSDLRAAIPKMCREDAYKWMEENGYGDLVVETINPSTLKAFCKRRIKDGEPLPEDLFKLSPFSRASVTKIRS